MPAVRSRQNLVEAGFVAVLLVLCGVLTALQYHWTGELARAELAHGRRSLDEQSLNLTRSFDEDLTQACTQLLPRGSEIESSGRDAAHLERLRAWLTTNPRPMFRRMAVASRTAGTPDLFKLETGAEYLAPMSWPDEWESLRENLSRKGNVSSFGEGSRPPPGPRPRDRPREENYEGGSREFGDDPRGEWGDRDRGGPDPSGRRSPSFIDPQGVLLEFPFLAVRGGGGERGWLILELDLDYVRDIWLPELIREYLDPNDRRMNDIRVSVIGESGSPFFTAFGGKVPTRFETSREFNRQGRNEATARGLPRRATWLFEASYRPGVLEEIVSASRRRNLAIAIMVNLLVLAAGGLLLHYTRRSRQLGAAQMAFVANVSHELRTPLTVIRGASHNLMNGIVSELEQVKEYGELINHNSEDLSEMVEQVLSFAATNRIAPAIHFQPVAVNEILREAIAASEPDIQAAKCVLETDIDEASPMINGDSSALGRAFRNLIGNAAKHGGTGGWIGLKVRTVSGASPYVEIEVADRGVGIPIEEQDHVFTPFFRGASAQTRQVRGSGIGLSLVKEIVEAHGGRILLRSGNTPGTVFIIHLPAMPGTSSLP